MQEAERDCSEKGLVGVYSYIVILGFKDEHDESHERGAIGQRSKEIHPPSGKQLN
jgi:hypothetical protein